MTWAKFQSVQHMLLPETRLWPLAMQSEMSHIEAPLLVVRCHLVDRVVWQKNRLATIIFGASKFLFELHAHTHACRKFQFGNHSDLFSKNIYFKVSKREKKRSPKKRFSSKWLIFYGNLYNFHVFSIVFSLLLRFALLYLVICCLCKIVVDLILSTEPAIIRNFSLNAFICRFLSRSLVSHWFVALWLINAVHFDFGWIAFNAQVNGFHFYVSVCPSICFIAWFNWNGLWSNPLIDMIAEVLNNIRYYYIFNYWKESNKKRSMFAPANNKL